MRAIWIQRVAFGSLAVIGLMPIPYVLETLGIFDESPFDPTLAAAAACLLAGAAVAGGYLLARSLWPRLRARSWLLAAGLAALAVMGARWPSASFALGLEAMDRFSFWRNGSELYVASPRFLAWTDRFAERLARRPEHAREAYFVRIRLGDYFLRVGARERSVAEFEQALEILELRRAAIERQSYSLYETKMREVLRWLAIANLRAGEVEHCIGMVAQESCIYPLEGAGLWSNPSGAQKAEAWLLRLLEIAPSDPGARWLLNVAVMAQGRFPEGVPPEHRLPADEFAGSVTAPRFTNIGPEVGVHHYSVAGGSVMEDFDGDGFLDLAATCINSDANMVMYRNDGAGGFKDVTEQAGLVGQRGGLSIVQGDYDNDGWIDLFIPRGAWLGDQGRFPNSLLRNRGDGTFEDVTASAGLLTPAWPCLAAAFCDYDNDGDLDLYVGNERLRPGEYAPSQMFRNEGDGRFTDVAEEAGLTNDRYARGVSWGDYDRDGDWDLYVSNFGEANRLYRNQGDGTFTDVAPQLGVALQTEFPKKQRSFQSWFFDANNDGWLDIFSASYPLSATGGSVDGAAASMFGEPVDVETCKLWINDGTGRFRDATVDWGLNRSVSVMGANFGDIDNDGWQDFYLATGAPAYEVLLPNMLFLNLNGRGFGNATVASGLGHLQKGHGVAMGDVDNDGDLDLYVQLGGWYLDDRYYNALFRNDGPPAERHWITVQLRGVESNRFGVGCTIRAVTLEDGEERDIYAQVGSGASFGASSLQAEMGLGRAERLLRLEIYWPRSRYDWQVIEEPPMDCAIRLREGEAGYERVNQRPLRLGSSPAAITTEGAGRE